jgi:hypothetical protein
LSTRHPGFEHFGRAPLVSPVYSVNGGCKVLSDNLTLSYEGEITMHTAMLSKTFSYDVINVNNGPWRSAPTID